MEYHGKLFGKIGNKYFDTGRTSEDFDNMSKRLAEFVGKLIKVRESFYNSFPVPLKMEYCDAINNHLKALDEIIEPIKGFHPLVGMRPDPTSLFDDINAKPSEEERELAIKFMDETILQKDNSKGFTFGYRVHESEVGIPTRLHEADEAVIHSEGLKIDENGTFKQIKLEDRFTNPDMNTDLKGFHENSLRPEPTKFIIEDENGSQREVNPKMSFADFAKAFFPDNEISVHHEQIIEMLNKIAGTPSHLIIQGVRPINWYKSLAAMQETAIKLKEGKKCAIAILDKGNYIKQMKEFFDIDIELEELSENIYNIKLINKEE